MPTKTETSDKPTNTDTSVTTTTKDLSVTSMITESFVKQATVDTLFTPTITPLITEPVVISTTDSLITTYQAVASATSRADLTDAFISTTDEYITPTRTYHHITPTNTDHYLTPTRTDHYITPTRTDQYITPTIADHYITPTRTAQYITATTPDEYLTYTATDQYIKPTTTQTVANPTDTIVNFLQKASPSSSLSSSLSTPTDTTKTRAGSSHYYHSDTVSTSGININPTDAASVNVSPTKPYSSDHLLPSVLSYIMETSAYKFTSSTAEPFPFSRTDILTTPDVVQITGGDSHTSDLKQTSIDSSLQASVTLEAKLTLSTPSSIPLPSKCLSSVLSSIPSVISSSCRRRQKCPCRRMKATKTTANLTVAAVAKAMEKTKEKLTVDKSTLSSSVRKKTSAIDSRPSATTVGYIGIFILVLLALIVIIMDVVSFVRSPERYYKTSKRKKKQKKKKRSGWV
ncbi:cell wall protein DAN4-like [Mizuhopecten yessoensis]|uniref:cell wall protein DAN4-like n=1 Tax=Mizuhopecten yessoensis TaxID=6573 RepID=UPI000B45BC73|nr:cell wall protein DAN4-like [Mizuhopecten yessoensis]